MGRKQRAGLGFRKRGGQGERRSSGKIEKEIAVMDKRWTIKGIIKELEGGLARR